MDKVSVIIPTYNRFKYLLNAIKTVKEQTYSNIEIIVVNDSSLEREYYEYDWKENGIIIIHLKENSKKKINYACAGFVRNKGIEISSGKYIAFCDDDDSWFPQKIELQIKAMKETGCKMSSTDGLIGNAIYDPTNIYKKYNAEYYYRTLQSIYRNKGSDLLHNGFPRIWTLEFLKIHNCIICSSVVIEKDILDKIGNMNNLKNGQEDYDCWLRALAYTDSIYVEDICFYYDMSHGYGQNYL
jgi:glycosyltransferase involved in cell wall biosynthesis